MSSNLKDIMFFTTVMYGKRYSSRQKNRFASYVKSIAENNHMKFSVLPAKGNAKVYNFAVGDISKAKIILAGSYDTASRTLMPDLKYYPFNSKKNYTGEKKEFTLRLLAAVVIMAVYVGLLMLIHSDMSSAAMIPAHIICAFVAVKVLLGISNKYNFRRNSSSMAIIISLMEKYKSDRVAFLFIDKTTNGYEGFEALRDETKKLIDNRIVLYVGSTGKGEHLCLAGNMNDSKIRDSLNSATTETEKLNLHIIPVTDEMKEECLLFSFKKGIYLVEADEWIDGEPVICGTRTSKDCEIDFEILEAVKKIIINNADGIIR